MEAIGGPIGAGTDATFGEAPDEDVDLVLELEDLVRLCEWVELEEEDEGVVGVGWDCAPNV